MYGCDAVVKSKSFLYSIIKFISTRRWDLSGKLLTGYPSYWINNKKVTKEEFEKAAKNDLILMRSLNSISNQKPVNEQK